MKKICALVLFTVFVVLLFSGCGNTDAYNNSETPLAEATPPEITEDLNIPVPTEIIENTDDAEVGDIDIDSIIRDIYDRLGWARAYASLFIHRDNGLYEDTLRDGRIVHRRWHGHDDYWVDMQYDENGRLLRVNAGTYGFASDRNHTVYFHNDTVIHIVGYSNIYDYIPLYLYHAYAPFVPIPDSFWGRWEYQGANPWGFEFIVDGDTLRIREFSTENFITLERWSGNISGSIISTLESNITGAWIYVMTTFGDNETPHHVHEFTLSPPRIEICEDNTLVSTFWETSIEAVLVQAIPFVFLLSEQVAIGEGELWNPKNSLMIYDTERGLLRWSNFNGGEAHHYFERE